jgi:predicted secreted protein
MAAFAGRDFRIKYDSGSGAAVIAGAQTDDMTINKGEIEITDKDDSGIRTLLDDYGTWSCDLTCSGVLVGTQLSDLMDPNAATHLINIEVDWGALGTWTGKFLIKSFNVAGEDGENPATFSCSMTSSGEVTFA